jgi:PPOX class probable F420-dependent enzyme
MPAKLTEEDIALLNQPQIATIGTVNPDGSVHLTPVWIDTDGEAVVFNTARGRVKARNLERDPSVSVLVVDKDLTQRWVSFRGQAELISEGADAHVDKLAKKYLGQDKYPFRQDGEERVIVRVVPEHRVSS